MNTDHKLSRISVKYTALLCALILVLAAPVIGFADDYLTACDEIECSYDYTYEYAVNERVTGGHTKRDSSPQCPSGNSSLISPFNIYCQSYNPDCPIDGCCLPCGLPECTVCTPPDRGSGSQRPGQPNQPSQPTTPTTPGPDSDDDDDADSLETTPAATGNGNNGTGARTDDANRGPATGDIFSFSGLIAAASLAAAVVIAVIIALDLRLNKAKIQNEIRRAQAVNTP
jgi:hypothetical protein